MNDDDDTHTSMFDDKIATGHILDKAFSIQSPSESYIGADFTANHLLFTGEEIIELNDEESKKDSSGIYMRSLVDLFQSMNCKIDNLLLQRNNQDLLMSDVNKCIQLGNYDEALGLLKQISHPTSDYKYITASFLNDLRMNQVPALRNVFQELKYKFLGVKGLVDALVEKMAKRMDECDRLKVIVSQQKQEHMEQMNDLICEKNRIKDALIEFLSEYEGVGSLNSRLDDDLVSGLKNLVLSQKEDLKNLRLADEENKKHIREMKDLCERSDVKNLNKVIEDQRVAIKQLQQENISFSESVQKLSEKNIKLKQELVKNDTELKKAMDIIRSRNEAIQRQKSLIEMFQEKITGSMQFPIAELRRKKQEIEDKMERETDFMKKQALKREKTDYEKRLSDFIDLHNQQHK